MAAVSVSQKPNAPRVPDWDANEILDWLAQQYDSPEERREELGVEDGELINLAHSLEPDEGDLDKQVEFLDLVQELEEEYESEHWVNDSDVQYKEGAEGKKIYYGVIRDPENDDCWILVSETKYED